MRDIDLFEMALGLTPPGLSPTARFVLISSVKTVHVSWSRPESGFTLLFEAYILTLAKQMPMNAIADLVNEHNTRLWRILHHYVEDARAQVDYSQVQKIGVDETASKRGHHYITTFVDMEASKVIFATAGKDAAHTIKNHWQGVLRWFHSRLANGILEGINSLIQAAKARARGFRSSKNLITLVYLIAGKLKFHLPT